MCGIFGHVRSKEGEVALMTYAGLRDLEYRGYDSWGIAALTKEGLYTRKSVGKISDVNAEEFQRTLGKVAIGHSRWATHGGVSEVNAHPHFNREKNIAVVHNGIIENHGVLRAFLVEKIGIPESDIFISETDTEVVPHLIAYFVDRGKMFGEAFAQTVAMLEGRFALVAMKVGESELYAARDGAPLVVGTAPEGHFLASDVPAFIDYTSTVFYVPDRTIVRVSATNITVMQYDNGKRIQPVWEKITWDKASATKEGYPHFMLKEILEQPLALDKAIRQDEQKLNAIAHALNTGGQIFFIGCGTAAKMAKLGELFLARVAGKFTTTIVASEFASYEQFLNKKSVLVAVSQSGETADVLETLRVGKARGTSIHALLNVVGSSVDRISDASLFLNAGPEIAVASTKAATAQIAVLLLLAYAVCGKLAEGKHLLRRAVRTIAEWLTPELVHEIKPLAQKLAHASDLYIIGRGISAPLAHEAAIKIQEVAYIHAEGFPGGELKHGPIALITKGTPIIALVQSDETKRDMESSVMELRARGAYVIGISPENSKYFDEWIRTPDLGIASPIASLIPIQILAYHLAVLRGNDPDKPRNLAKSVTVK